MKKKILLVYFFSIVLFCNGSDYRNIDNQSQNIPSNLTTVKEISNYLVRNLKSPIDKTRAIYYWISNNIRYDLASLKSEKNYESTQMIVDEVLKNRKGVCQHYAELYKACCNAVGVTSYVISGYTDQKGEMGNYSHAWNAVLIDGNYYGVDATWAAGYLENGKYVFKFTDNFFLISPNELIKTHIPFDPIWQFSNNPITHKEIEKYDFTKLKTKGDFNFNDSINAQSKLSQLDAAIGISRRISKYGITNQIIRKEIAHNQQLIVSLKYNGAVELYNKAVANYNSYILYKNKQFQNTKLSEEELMDFISIAKNQIETSENTIRFLNSDNSTLNKSMNEMQMSLEKLKANINRELAFMKKYKKTLKPFRIFLFLSNK